MMRLKPHPSPWASFLGRLLFTTVWCGFCAGFSIMIWRHPEETPWFIFGVIGLFDLIAFGMLWDVVVRMWRTLKHREPVVEIDQRSLVYGGAAQLRVTEPHPESVAVLSVRLVGGNYDQELLRLSPATPDPLHRTLSLRMPDRPPEQDVSWKVVVGTTLRQGGTIVHSYPLRVD